MDEHITFNKHAIASVVLVVVAPLIWAYIYIWSPVYVCELFSLCLFISPVFIGIVTLIEIRKSKGKQKGSVFAWIGIVIGLFEVVAFCTWMSYEAITSLDDMGLVHYDVPETMVGFFFTQIPFYLLVMIGIIALYQIYRRIWR